MLSGSVNVAGQDQVSRIGTAGKVGLIVAILLPSPARVAVAESAYETCINNARLVHEASNAAECKRLADQTGQDRANCLGKLKLSPSYCDVSYPPRDGSPNCMLPAANATAIDAALERSRYRCAREDGRSQ